MFAGLASCCEYTLHSGNVNFVHRGTGPSALIRKVALLQLALLCLYTSL